MFLKLIKLPVFLKQLFIMLADSIIVIFILVASFSLRYEIWFWPEDNLFWLIILAPLVAVPIFIQFGLYRAIIRFIGFRSLWSIVQASTLYSIVWGVVSFMASVGVVPRSVIVFNWLLIMLFMIGSRMLARWTIEDLFTKNLSLQNVLVYGAGSAGRELSATLSYSNEYRPIALIDDSIELQGKMISGLEVFASNQIKSLIQKKNITAVLLALPAVSRSRRNKIIDFLAPLPVQVRSVPSMSELVTGARKIVDVREVDVIDLLGRDSVKKDKNLLARNIFNKVVIVSGAGGSIGSELCRQIVHLRPKTLILYDMSEFALYSIDKELNALGVHSVEILPILGSVNNRKKLSKIFKKFKVQTVYHAAAYKHVPMVELNTSEGVNNNIFGTLNCAQISIEENVETFVLISSDKAVRPTNTMGTSKRVAEIIVQALSSNSKNTRLNIVRFGNVLGSSGSVIPLFKKQIKDGGPMTVTSSKMMRYFMTIPEAVELVIQSGAMGSNGEVFVLDMGEPINIDALARKMIHLHGLTIKDVLNPNGDIKIEYIGLRPGEKLYEELLIGDNVSKTSHPMIMSAKEDMIEWDLLKVKLSEIKQAADDDDSARLRDLLILLVPEFIPQSEIVDVMHLAKTSNQ